MKIKRVKKEKENKEKRMSKNRDMIHIWKEKEKTMIMTGETKKCEYQRMI